MVLVVIFFLTSTFTSTASAQDGFPIPSIDWAEGIHGHGDKLWVAASNQGLLELTRGGSATRVANLRSAVAVGGHEATVVAAGYDRQLWRRRDGGWEQGPVLPQSRIGDRVRQIVVAPNGEVFIASRFALHVWSGDRALRTFPVEQELQTVAAANGRVFVGGRESIFELRDGSLRTPAFYEALRDELGERPPVASALWTDADGHLWIAIGSRKLAKVDLRTDRVAFREHPLFGAVRSLESDGERVFVAAQSGVGVIEATGFRPLGPRLSFPEEIHLDGATLYVANRQGLTAIDVGSGSSLVGPVAPVLENTRSASISISSLSARTESSSGLRIENLDASSCGLIGAMAIAVRTQEAAGACVPAGESIGVEMTLRGGRPTRVAVTTSNARALRCSERALRRMRVPGAAPSCTVRLDVAR